MNRYHHDDIRHSYTYDIPRHRVSEAEITPAAKPAPPATERVEESTCVTSQDVLTQQQEDQP